MIRSVNKPLILLLKSIVMLEKKFVVILLNEISLKPSKLIKYIYILFLSTPNFRLKQLYAKFDDVIASGRMIAKSSDTTDDGKRHIFLIVNSVRYK